MENDNMKNLLDSVKQIFTKRIGNKNKNKLVNMEAIKGLGQMPNNIYMQTVSAHLDNDTDIYRFRLDQHFKYVIGVIVNLPDNNTQEPFIVGFKQHNKYILNPLPHSFLRGQDQVIFNEKFVPINAIADGEDIDVSVDCQGSDHDFDVNLVFLLSNVPIETPFEYGYDKIVLEQVDDQTVRLNIDSLVKQITGLSFVLSNYNAQPKEITVKDTTTIFLNELSFGILNVESQGLVKFDDAFVNIEINTKDLFIRYTKNTVTASTLYFIYKYTENELLNVRRTR